MRLTITFNNKVSDRFQKQMEIITNALYNYASLEAHADFSPSSYVIGDGSGDLMYKMQFDVADENEAKHLVNTIYLELKSGVKELTSDGSPLDDHVKSLLKELHFKATMPTIDEPEKAQFFVSAPQMAIARK